jgi:hypothetical protein
VSAGIEPLLRAFVEGRRDFDAGALSAPLIRHALDRGLGPLLVHVGALDQPRRPPFADEIRASDLTARLLTADKLEVLRDVLRQARTVAPTLVLLKGAATSLRYYPKPHLRMMGDMDILLDPRHQRGLEDALRALGLVQRSHEKPGSFVDRHHSMPFVHPDRGVWIEVHTRVIPRQQPLARAPLFAPETVRSQSALVAVGDQVACAMGHELQLVYTSSRWAEGVDPERGIFPMLDAALLLRTQGDTLNWDRVCDMAQGTWAITALRLMLRQLVRSSLATVPDGTLRWLDNRDRHVGRCALSVLQGITRRFVLEGRPFGRVLARPENVATVWDVLVRPSRPVRNLARIPYSLAGTFYRTHISARISAR